jgi:hypothetical protein
VLALVFGSGLAHAALPKPNCTKLTATAGAPAQGAVDLVFTNEWSFVCQLRGFPKVVLQGPAGSTYKAVHAAGRAAVVQVQPGMTVHVHLTYAPAGATCEKWSASAVDVTLPVAGVGPFDLTLRGVRRSVDRRATPPSACRLEARQRAIATSASSPRPQRPEGLAGLRRGVARGRPQSLRCRVHVQGGTQLLRNDPREGRAAGGAEGALRHPLPVSSPGHRVRHAWSCAPSLRLQRPRRT